MIQIYGIKASTRGLFKKRLYYKDFSAHTYYIEESAVVYTDPIRNEIVLNAGAETLYFKISGASQGFDGVMKQLEKGTK